MLVKMAVVNKPEVSKGLLGFYLGTAVFVAVVVGTSFYFSVQAAAFSAAGAVGLVAVFGFVEGIMIWLVVRDSQNHVHTYGK